MPQGEAGESKVGRGMLDGAEEKNHRPGTDEAITGLKARQKERKKGAGEERMGPRREEGGRGVGSGRACNEGAAGGREEGAERREVGGRRSKERVKLRCVEKRAAVNGWRWERIN